MGTATNTATDKDEPGTWALVRRARVTRRAFVDFADFVDLVDFLPPPTTGTKEKWAG
jgi:hypothetical protein